MTNASTKNPPMTTSTQAVDASQGLTSLVQRLQNWSEPTFGPGRATDRVIDHIKRELREVKEDPTDTEEWADIVLLALDGAWRTGALPEEVAEAVISKLAKNERRTWPDWRTAPPGRAIEHIPGEGES